MDVITSTSVNGDIPSKRIEDRFTAAVNVIRGLPKNGSYQPSNDMMLRFYSYYKQATLGPCTQKKPPFWDVVGRAKYESYKSLGKMSKERAMELYVDELKKIIETMSYTDNVAEFMGSINELDGVDVDDLEVVAPEAIKKVKSQPNSPFASREASPIRASDRPFRYDYTNGTSNGHMHNGHLNTAEPSDDEYIDTVEDDPQLIEEPVRCSRPARRIRINQTEVGAFHSNDADNHSTNTVVAMNNTVQTVPTITQVLKMVESMRSDLQQIHSRINLLERSLSDVRNQQLRKKILELKYPRWWPFVEISPTWFVFMILWPFMAQRIMQAIQRKK
ncbi:acyl-CoA-binding domain-containing protein 5 [Contarinia nasturtii]|uniref:acyl-CoA-binding domain-containing protein 5 n=1 Tax=Contarinia nasturtii TaxID=265458 RepID=UPI0012D3D122|nr:acyl-CoA-binding domain-containing protein 5 [Contarinia nasturtii]XP_031621100.1 acyl-CoA-binding domain-containing protein 5 [Contarinia nasturtii]